MLRAHRITPSQSGLLDTARPGWCHPSRVLTPCLCVEQWTPTYEREGRRTRSGHHTPWINPGACPYPSTRTLINQHRLACVGRCEGCVGLNQSYMPEHTPHTGRTLQVELAERVLAPLPTCACGLSNKQGYPPATNSFSSKRGVPLCWLTRTRISSYCTPRSR